MDNHICHFSFSNKSGHHYYEDNTRPCNKTKVTEVICLTLKCIFKNIFKSIQSFIISWGLLLRLSILFSSLLFQSFLLYQILMTFKCLPIRIKTYHDLWILQRVLLNRSTTTSSRTRKREIREEVRWTSYPLRLSCFWTSSELIIRAKSLFVIVCRGNLCKRNNGQIKNMDT